MKGTRIPLPSQGHVDSDVEIKYLGDLPDSARRIIRDRQIDVEKRGALTERDTFMTRKEIRELQKHGSSRQTQSGKSSTSDNRHGKGAAHVRDKRRDRSSDSSASDPHRGRKGRSGPAKRSRQSSPDPGYRLTPDELAETDVPYDAGAYTGYFSEKDSEDERQAGSYDRDKRGRSHALSRSRSTGLRTSRTPPSNRLSTDDRGRFEYKEGEYALEHPDQRRPRTWSTMVHGKKHEVVVFPKPRRALEPSHGPSSSRDLYSPPDARSAPRSSSRSRPDVTFTPNASTRAFRPLPAGSIASYD